MKAAIDKIAETGFSPDLPDMALPSGSWTDSRNVCFRDGAVEKVRGYTQALGDLSATSIWAAPITDGTNYFWAYGSNTVFYATDGSTHANITGSLSPNATDDLGFTGGPFHGYMIANDGAGIPQSWNPSLANDFVSLTAWPASITAKVMRPFKDFLFAFRITDTGAYNPRLMRWSDRAAQGGLPLSWDFSDPTNQAGINELGQTSDQIIDGLPLRDSLVIYKEFHTWIADYIGGQDIFSFRQVFSQLGMLTENCAAAFGSSHVVLTDNDLVLHNGNDAQSLADKRTRRWLFNRINGSRFKRSFVVADHRNRQVKVCFPESGRDWPNLALVWDWANNTFHVEDLGGPKTYAATGIIPGTAVSFDADSGTFDEAAGSYDEETYNPFLTRVLLLDSTARRAYQNDTGEDFNGTPMTCYAERSSIAITKDLSMMKRVKRLFPKVIGTPGDVLRFYIGTRTKQNASTEWRGPYTYTIGTDYKIDLRVTSRVLDLRVEYGGTNTFRLYGFDVEFENDGTR
jgi:hypothetical protein